MGTIRKTRPLPNEQLPPDRELAYGIADEVRRLRDEREWNGTELARAAGMKQPHISRLENANKGLPSLSTLLRIASATNTQLTITFTKQETTP